MEDRRFESYADLSSISPEREPFVNGSPHQLDGDNHNTSSIRKDEARSHNYVPTWLENKQTRRENLSQLMWTGSLAIVIALILGIFIGNQISLGAAPSPAPAATAPPCPVPTSTPVLDQYPQQCRASEGRWNPIKSTLLKNGTTLEKPSGIKIVAVIFFGRRQFVDILDCYLRRNLVTNGGFLDEVHFILHDSDPADKEWLSSLLDKDEAELEGRFKVFRDKEIEKLDRFDGFSKLWEKYLTDPEVLYFKIDDDIVFIDDAAIPRMTYSLLGHPEAHNIQANVVNNMRTHWYHLRTGAIRPYLPETMRMPPPCCNSSWRASELPCYDGKLPKSYKEFDKAYRFDRQNHRWLPLENTPKNMMLTPFGAPLPPVEKCCRKPGISWTTEAQLHYSFLHNLEHDLLSRYDFGNDEGIWNLWFGKYNINFMAVRGSTVSLLPFWGEDARLKNMNDERGMILYAPKNLQMPVLVDTRAVVSHYSFRGIRKHLLKTDLLSRYRAYANEMVCGPRHQKVAFDDSPDQHGKDPQHGDEDVDDDEEDASV